MQAENDEEVWVEVALPMGVVAELLRAKSVADIHPEAIADLMAAVKSQGRLVSPPPSSAPAQQKNSAAEVEKERQQQLFGSLLTRAEDIQPETRALRAAEDADVAVKQEEEYTEMTFPLLDDLEVALGNK